MFNGLKDKLKDCGPLCGLVGRSERSPGRDYIVLDPTELNKKKERRYIGAPLGGLDF